MRNVKTRNDIIHKVWARSVSQIHWNVENLIKLLKERHEPDKYSDDVDLNKYAMIESAIKEIRVLKMQVMISNINWKKFGLQHPTVYAMKLVNKKIY